jgi:hypothetical protein
MTGEQMNVGWRTLRCLTVSLALLASLALLPGSAGAMTLPPGSITVPTTGTFLYLNSQPGDYVGGGAEYLYTSADSTINAQLPPGGEYFATYVLQGSYVHVWNVAIAAPLGQSLAVGTYPHAVNVGVRTSAVPGLAVSSDTRGCNVISGQFDVTALSHAPSGELLVFDATFEQHCEGATAALFGRIRIENPVPGPTVSLPSGAISVPTSGSFLYLNSQVGDWIGQGTEQLYTGTDSIIRHWLFEGGNQFEGSIYQASGPHSWSVILSAPVGEPLAVRSYLGASMRVGGDGRGCSTLLGRFDVDELSFWSSGDLRVFQATFEQHCEYWTAALFGRIRVEAPEPPPPPELGVTVDSPGTARSGQATLTGTVTCSRPVPLVLSGSLTQVLPNHPIVGGAFTSFTYCSGSATWSAVVMDQNGNGFNSGAASASVVASVCETRCYWISAAVEIKLNAGVSPVATP